jgi:hypothetical protein
VVPFAVGGVAVPRAGDAAGMADRSIAYRNGIVGRAAACTVSEG